MEFNFSQNSSLSFPGQLQNEKAISILRRHRIVLLWFAIYFLVMIFLPFFLFKSFDFIFGIPLLGATRMIFFFFVGLHLLFTVILSFSIFIDYYLDVWIITDQRIISIEQKGLFNRTINEVRFERIQDITSVVPGFFATYFKYGNVFIQTAGESERMVLKQIPDPIETRRLISEIYDRALEHRHNREK